VKIAHELPLDRDLNAGRRFETRQDSRGTCSLKEPSGAPFWKRILDICCLLLAAPTVVPLMLIISAFIKIASPGPVFFKQERIGFRGKKFLCLKFRSMKVNADTKVHQNMLKDMISSDTPMTKMDSKGDPRIIPFGSILRSSGLDELPQLINVLRGDMSLVGPRPCTPYEYEQYDSWHKERFRAVPGLTGLWQVSGKNRTTFNEMINLDIQYAEDASPLMDIKIMFRTLPVLFAQIRDAKDHKPKD
jgi:lipopolysaccharide/colanic/teichoic acid biosynthesis glycosyltransferase